MGGCVSISEPGLQCDAGVLPVALPGGHGEREGRPRAQARQDRRGPQLARRRRARLRLLALVATLRQGSALGLEQEGSQVMKDMDRMAAFTKALKTWAGWVDANLVRMCADLEDFQYPLFDEGVVHVLFLRNRQIK
ncbi:uncharacterized protein LOC123439845 isoform X2 [Hordeum vulgare subsp. vulgare]|uniref:uncharacterized protein LOC123439845 isoform X2 n=1 Tax=Hordeum vulgare subsp. vulgare TaxID=112509 RepID=UPI000B47DDF8|nr:uncharacterized protein LOC123439845 isoform X2 [Hordeum vulgare subsp. vulgare]